jgi:peptide/nickel transport system substrate-binding protein
MVASEPVRNLMKLHNRVAGAMVLALTATLTIFSTAPSQAAAPVLTVASLSDVKNWDPSQAHLGHPVPLYQTVYDTLFLRDSSGTIRPNLATKWYFDSTKLHLKVTLKSGVKFTDGENFDAAAAAVNIMNNKNSNGPDASQIADISDVTVNSPTTITINFTTPNPGVLNYLSGSSGFIGAPKLIGTPSIVTAPVGSGPYIFNAGKSSKGSKYVFDANPNYWNKASQKFSSVTWLIMADTTARLNALLSGQVDAALLDVKTASAAKSGGATLHESNVDVSNIMLMDRTGSKNKALGDIRVRQAINFAFDKEAMLKAVQNGIGSVTDQMFGPASGAYDSALESVYSYDPAKAKALLAQAGYQNGFELSMPNFSFSDPTLQAFISQYLAAIGITVKWADISPSNYISDLKAAKYSAAWFQLFQGTPWEEIKLIATPDATWNTFKVSDPVITSLVAKIQRDPAAINTSAAKINAEIVKQGWYVPLFRLSQQFFTGKHVTVVPQPQQAVPSLFNYSPTGA